MSDSEYSNKEDFSILPNKAGKVFGHAFIVDQLTEEARLLPETYSNLIIFAIKCNDS